MSRTNPLERDVRAILDAAGVHDVPREAIARAQAALAAYSRSLYPRIVKARNRWKHKALYLRDIHCPGKSWSELDADDPTEG